MSHELEIIELLINKLVEQAIENKTSYIIRRLNEEKSEMANANSNLIQENLRLSKEVSELKGRIEIMKINEELDEKFKDDF